MTTTARPTVETIIETAQEEAERTRDRIRKGVEILLARNEPPVGVTPKEVIYQRGTLKLYHYRPMSDEVYRVPVVFVMSLVSKPWILDLTFGQSFIQYMLAQGFDVFMIDWGVPRPEDKRLRFEDYVTDLMPDCFEHVQKATGEEEYSILGYCMGGLFGLMYAGTYPDAPLKNLACAATPVDMEGMGLFRKWQNPRYFDVDRLVDSLGNIPPEMMLRSFELLRPMDRWGGYLRLIDNLWNEQFVYGFRIMYKWTNEQIPFPGETYRQFTKDLMWENKLMKGTYTLDGRRVDTSAIKIPVLHAMAEHDHIAPYAATKPLTDIVGSEDKEDIVVKGGHVSLVAGKNAMFRLWPKVADWLAQRSV
ncbi:MAG TPA: alpha/beta fold hydrolase [Dehalococcoidia bacterium]|nr:alpha/beta fold hydrolase [Dehalococcoidia bacterium]